MQPTDATELFALWAGAVWLAGSPDDRVIRAENEDRRKERIPTLTFIQIDRARNSSRSGDSLGHGTLESKRVEFGRDLGAPTM